MNINEQFESKYLKASDLGGRPARVKINQITTEEVGRNKDFKIVLYFAGKKKGMICNRTNGMTIAEVWGPETDNWIGAELELFSMRVPFEGKLTDGLRVRPLPPSRQAPAPRPATANMAPNARDRAAATQAPYDDGWRGDEAAKPSPVPAAASGSGGGYAELDDDIPFSPEWR